MGKLKSVKLPHLPGSAPEGSMAMYLSQVRQNNSEEVKKTTEHDLLCDSVSKSKPSEESASNMPNGKLDTIESKELVNVPVIDNEATSISNEVASSYLENNFTSSENFNPTLALQNELSENDTFTSKTKAIENIDNSIEKENKSDVSVVRKQRGKQESIPKSEKALVNYINSLPQYVTNIYLKGEVKVRISPEIATFLKIIIDSTFLPKKNNIVADNLVNHLLSEFFSKYSGDLEQIAIEYQQKIMLQYEDKLSLIKRKAFTVKQ